MTEMKDWVVNALDDLKALDVKPLYVAPLTTITDHMIIATGTSSRHVQAIAQHLITTAKQHRVVPLGVEGENEAEWVLIDLGDCVVHVMSQQARDFYQLEKLWSFVSTEESAAIA